MPRSRFYWPFGLSLPALTLFAASAYAQEAPQGASFRVVGAAIGSGETDLGDDASLQWTRSIVGAEFLWTRSPRNSYGAELLLGRTRYEFDATLLGDTDLDVDEAQLSFPIRLPIGEHAGAYIAPQIQFAGEESVSFDDGATYGAITGIAWQLSPDLLVGPGLGITTTLKDGGLDVFPFLVVDWAFADRWSLSTGSGFAASRGPGLRVAYKPRDDLEFGLEARYEEFEFRLNEDHDLANGVGTDTSIPAVLTARYEPNDTLRVSGFAGAAFGGSLSFEDESGDKIFDEDYDVVPIFGFSASLRF
ncbi:MAG: hypothetical protein AAGG56_12355 [Pseudomonadota bacterium]